MIAPITVPLVILCGLVGLLVLSALLIIPLPGAFLNRMIKRPVIRVINSPIVFRLIMLFSVVCVVSAYNSYFGFRVASPFESTAYKSRASTDNSMHLSRQTEKYYRSQRTFYLSTFAFYASIVVLCLSSLYAKLFDALAAQKKVQPAPSAPNPVKMD